MHLAADFNRPESVIEIETHFGALEEREQFHVSGRYAVLEKHAGMISAQRQPPLGWNAEEINLHPAPQLRVEAHLLDFAGDLDTAIAIRTGVLKDGVIHVQAGGGLVADSVPEMEYDECRNKAAAVLRAAAAASTMNPA